MNDRSRKKQQVKAIIISSYGGPEVLTATELPDPVPADSEVLIAVKAFGLNHAEAYMRSGAFGEVAKVTGIECAGTVVADPSGRLAAGTTVVAILGGMGRTRNGSYAELVTVPASNVVEVSTSLPWTDLVALPEVYSTAWAGLRQNLDLRPGQTVLIRGATSALGQAAVNVAAEQGADVIATTRNPDRAALLERIGAKTVLIDDGRLFLNPPPPPHKADHWPAIGTVMAQLRARFPDTYIGYWNDVIIRVPRGMGPAIEEFMKVHH